MKKVKKVLRVGINLVAIYLIIRFLGYLLTDEPMWESPYDEGLVQKKNFIILDMEKGDLESLLYAVGEYAERWTGKQELLDIWFYSENNTFFSRCSLYYGAGRIDEYWGRCMVTCVYNKEKGYWEITKAEKKYWGERIPSVNRKI